MAANSCGRFWGRHFVLPHFAHCGDFAGMNFNVLSLLVALCNPKNRLAIIRLVCFIATCDTANSAFIFQKIQSRVKQKPNFSKKFIKISQKFEIFKFILLKWRFYFATKDEKCQECVKSQAKGRSWATMSATRTTKPKSVFCQTCAPCA